MYNTVVKHSQGLVQSNTVIKVTLMGLIASFGSFSLIFD